MFRGLMDCEKQLFMTQVDLVRILNSLLFQRSVNRLFDRFLIHSLVQITSMVRKPSDRLGSLPVCIFLAFLVEEENNVYSIWQWASSRLKFIHCIQLSSSGLRVLLKGLSNGCTGIWPHDLTVRNLNYCTISVPDSDVSDVFYDATVETVYVSRFSISGADVPSSLMIRCWGTISSCR